MSQLLEPDNEIIKAATAQLRSAFKQPGVIPELCKVLRQVLCTMCRNFSSLGRVVTSTCSTSEKVQIRQYAAVLLRKKFSKSHSWLKLAPGDRAQLKAGCLSCLLSEPERSVRTSVAQLTATVARYSRLKDGRC